jgi:hypothetical protein
MMDMQLPTQLLLGSAATLASMTIALNGKRTLSCPSGSIVRGITATPTGVCGTKNVVRSPFAVAFEGAEHMDGRALAITHISAGDRAATLSALGATFCPLFLHIFPAQHGRTVAGAGLCWIASGGDKWRMTDRAGQMKGAALGAILGTIVAIRKWCATIGTHERRQATWHMISPCEIAIPWRVCGPHHGYGCQRFMRPLKVHRYKYNTIAEVRQWESVH